MNARSFSPFSHIFSTVTALGLVLAVVGHLAGQNAAAQLTVLSREGRRTIPVVTVGDQEMVALDDLSAAFQLAVREEAGALTVSYKARTIVLTPDQPIVSVSGRLISLAAAPTRSGSRWVVPLDFISRALAPIYDTPLDLRRASHLLVVGDLRVPRISIRHEPLGNAARVTIDATPRTASAVAQEGTQRLAIKFEADSLDVAFPAFQSQGFVQGFRLVDPVTIGIDLGPRFSAFRASALPLDGSTRLVLDFVAAATDAPTPTVPTTTSSEPPPDLPFFGPTPAIRTVAIDPGHGGSDIGSKGPDGTAEKDVTLAVARRLKASVEGRLGIRVVMTRDDDRNVLVTDRAAIANNNKADVFISLHANASLRPELSGTAIYIAAFDDSEEARQALVPERLPAFGGGFRDIELVPWYLAQIRYKDKSATMAAILAQQLQDRLPASPHPVERAPLRILESANMPAVLIEMGYLSNVAQEKQLAGNDFQGGAVQAIVDAIIRFRDLLTAQQGVVP